MHMGNVQSNIEPNEIGSKIFNQNKYEFFNTKPNCSNTYWSILYLNATQM